MRAATQRSVRVAFRADDWRSLQPSNHGGCSGGKLSEGSGEANSERIGEWTKPCMEGSYCRHACKECLRGTVNSVLVLSALVGSSGIGFCLHVVILVLTKISVKLIGPRSMLRMNPLSFRPHAFAVLVRSGSVDALL